MKKIEDITLKNGRSLKEVLEVHKNWLKDLENGKKADLSYEDLSYIDLSDSDLRYGILEGAYLRGANLIGADLESANLIGVNLSYADLIKADLEGANLTGANLSYADLRSANLRGANLKDANLTGTDLKGANLTGANLINTNLTSIKYNNITSFFALQCPEKGSFIGYKKADDKIIELLITEDSKRSSATTRKCRCSKAKVLSITSLDGKKSFKKVISDYDSNFIYEVGKIVEVKDFDNNRWQKCSTGIHFFITRDEAVRYQNF